MTALRDLYPMPGIDPGLAHAASALTVADHFAARVRLAPDRPAVADGRLALSYAQLDERAARLAGALAARGVARGDRVAVLAENRGEFLELFLGCARIGAIACCQNWRLADEELRHCLGLVAPTLLLASPRFAETAGRVAPQGCAALAYGDAYEAALAEAGSLPWKGRGRARLPGGHRCRRNRHPGRRTRCGRGLSSSASTTESRERADECRLSDLSRKSRLHARVDAHTFCRLRPNVPPSWRRRDSPLLSPKRGARSTFSAQKVACSKRRDFPLLSPKSGARSTG